MTDDPDDSALEALVDLIAQIERTTNELDATIGQARQVAAARVEGRSWREIVENEQQPLVVERMSRVLQEIGVAGNRFRREEARALIRSGLSTTEVSTLFGVTRQRISALVS